MASGPTKITVAPWGMITNAFLLPDEPKKSKAKSNSKKSSGGGSGRGYSGGGYSRGGGGRSGGGGGSAEPTTTTSIEYDYTSAWDANAVLYAGLTQILGRKPTSAELKSYRKSLKQVEKKHPTKTVTKRNADGTEQTLKQTGGLSEGGRSQWTQNWVNKHMQGEADAVRINDYFKVMLDALGPLGGEL